MGMDEGTKQGIALGIFIILFASVLASSIIIHRDLKTKNFQTTIKDLSDGQKCLHICGFEFHTYFEQYKICVEKCNGILERENNMSGVR